MTTTTKTTRQLLLLLLILFSSSCITKVLGKKKSGTFKLSGASSTNVLLKFAISAYGTGELTLKLQAEDMYEDERSLRVHTFIDVDWPKVKKAATCSEKVRYAKKTYPITFDYQKVRNDNPMPSKKNNNQIYVNAWVNEMKSIKLEAPRDVDIRNHYWYVVIDDCSLENYGHDSKIPTIKYDIIALNDFSGSKNKDGSSEGSKKLTHLSADESSMKTLHGITFLISTFLTFMLFMKVGMVILSGGKSPSSSGGGGSGNTIHIAVFLVMGATLVDALSSLFQLLHLLVYESDGVGSYFLDALSSHFEAICDSIVSILLLSIGAGWTLPSDVIHTSSVSTQTGMQKLVDSIRNPTGGNNMATILAITIIITHSVLAQWGRTYDDDFDTYHDLEHLPGRILMFIRLLLGLLLIIASYQTSLLSSNVSLKAFYGKLAIVGTSWFISLPVTTFLCSWFVPYYLRHPAVATLGSIVQTLSLISLCWLVTAHSTSSSYHKLSRLNSNADKDLTDQLGSATMTSSSSMMGNTNNGGGNISSSTSSQTKKSWKFGKTKIRLD